MVEECCDNNNAHFGVPNCFTDLPPCVGIYFQKTFDADGVKNKIALSAISGQGLKDKLVEAAEQRWYPLGELTDVTLPIADSQIQTYGNGRKKFLREGVRSFSAKLIGDISTWVTKNKLAGKRCGKWSFYLVFADNTLMGQLDPTGYYFMGIPMDEQSVDPKFMFPTDEAGQENNLMFDFERNFKDAKLYTIKGDKLTNVGLPDPVDFLNPSTIIIDCTLKQFLAPTATTFNFIVNDDYRQGTRTASDGLGNVTGLSFVDDMNLFNRNTGLSVTISAMVENSDGEYTITFTAQTADDVMELVLNQEGTSAIEYAGSVKFTAV